MSQSKPSLPMAYPPISPKFPHFLHGGDYNPDQWPESVWHQDMRLMKLANCNTMSVGIFAWARLEPQEGQFDFAWLDKTMDLLTANDGYAVLATPSGARPAWMSQKYPQVLRVREDRRRILHSRRHNHCPTSPVYREKVNIVNTKLAERYKDHPALLVWHISNEYGGECHCDLCQEQFRQFLQRKYKTLDALNAAWWSSFWAHTYSDWSQIESPSPTLGEVSVHGQVLDWKRFVTYQTIDFCKAEMSPLRRLTPNVPITTNFMRLYNGLDYHKFAPELDVISWDCYPSWRGCEKDWLLAAEISFVHDLFRTMKNGKPWMLMECTPSMVNWQAVNKLKRPGVHELVSLQAVAHGSDTVQYFQWRKSRGSAEKFHGAVVDHCGHENTRVFQEVANLGQSLKKLDPIIGTTTRPEVAIVFDWENRWAIEAFEGMRTGGDRGYVADLQAHYRQFWTRGIAVDVIESTADLSRYKLVIAPMLYMTRPGVAGNIEKFVADGGTFVTTYISGIVDENDLVHLGGLPGPLRKVLGIWSEEIDSLYDGEKNTIKPTAGNEMNLTGRYEAAEFCDLIHAETAQVLATYGEDFYAGRPAVTVNSFGKGKAYYIASRNDTIFLNDFYAALEGDLELKRALGKLPQGVTAQIRSNGKSDFVFLMNFRPAQQTVELPEGSYDDLLNGGTKSGSITLEPWGVLVLKAGAMGNRHG